MFFHFQEAFLHQKSYNIDMLSFSVFFHHLLSLTPLSDPSSFLVSLPILTLLTLNLRPALPKSLQWAFIKLCEENTWNQVVTFSRELAWTYSQAEDLFVVMPPDTNGSLSGPVRGSHSVVLPTPPPGLQMGPMWHLFVICSSSFYWATVVTCFWAPTFIVLQQLPVSLAQPIIC